MLDLTPEEWTAVRLSLQVATVGDAGQPAVRHRRRLAAGARAASGASRCSTALVHLPLILPPVVTGYLLLLAFGRRGPIGAFLAEHFGIVFSFRWTGAALACGGHGLPADGARDPPVDRGGRPQARGGGRHARRQPRSGCSPPSRCRSILPGIIAGAILSFAKAMGEFGATITFVSNIPGETQTLPSAIYTFTQVPGGDAGALRLTLVSIAIAMAALLASEAAGAARRPADGRSNDASRSTSSHRLGDFALDARFASGGRLTALFGRSGSGKTTLVNVDRRPDPARRAAGSRSTARCWSTPTRGIFVPRAPAPHRLRLPGRRGCSRI